MLGPMSTLSTAEPAVTQPGDEMPQISADELVARTRRELLRRAKRSSVPVRAEFVQRPPGSDVRASVLADFVRRRDQRGLNAYLITLALTSSADASHDWWTTLDIGAWARLYGTTLHAEQRTASNAVSKIMKRLEDRQLLRRERAGRERKIKVQLLREDGSGQDYTRPHGNAAGERFLKLSHAYWLERWDEKLSLPGLAMLLVALREKHGFKLPTERMPEWYGWSADTAERGFAELKEHRLIRASKNHRFDATSPTGFTYFNTYELQPPFAPPLTPEGSGE